MEMETKACGFEKLFQRRRTRTTFHYVSRAQLKNKIQIQVHDNEKFSIFLRVYLCFRFNWSQFAKDFLK